MSHELVGIQRLGRMPNLRATDELAYFYRSGTFTGPTDRSTADAKSSPRPRPRIRQPRPLFFGRLL